MSAIHTTETEYIPGARLRTTQIPIPCPFTEDEISHAWERCSNTVQQHCDQMISRWKEEIDMYLVFNGLFSAVLTAFNVQSYALLQQDNTDLLAAALTQVSAQLSHFTLNGTSMLSSASTFVPSPFSAPVSAVWINALWFASLVCTLSASSIAIMVKQWLHQYDLGLSGNSHEVARVRQYRYESLVKWRVVEIVAFLPIIPQLSLLLFLAGLLILLWTLHHLIAGIAMVLIGGLVVFTVATTILPAIKADCFYQSQLALGFFLALQALRSLFRKSKVGPSTFRNWHAREKYEVQIKRSDLDRQLAATTYGICLDDHVLNDVVLPCMWDLPSRHLSPMLDDVFRIANRWEPLVPCALHFTLIAAREGPGHNAKAVRKLLSSTWWPRMDPASELGELFVRAMATLVSRGVEADYAFYRVSRSLSYLTSNSGSRVKQDVVEHLVSIYPNPRTGKQFASLVRSKDPEGLPMVYSYLLTLPTLVRYLARLVVDSPHETERIQLHIDAMFHTLQSFLMHIAWTQDLSNLSITLWALARSRHVAQMVALKTDAYCSPLVPRDIVETYQDVLSNINSSVTTKAFQMYFKRHLDRLTTANLGTKDPAEIGTMLQNDVDVLAKLFQINLSHLSGRPDVRGTHESEITPPKSPTYNLQRFVSAAKNVNKAVGSFQLAADNGPSSRMIGSPRSPRHRKTATAPTFSGSKSLQPNSTETSTPPYTGMLSLRTALVAGSSKDGDGDGRLSVDSINNAAAIVIAPTASQQAHQQRNLDLRGLAVHTGHAPLPRPLPHTSGSPAEETISLIRAHAPSDEDTILEAGELSSLISCFHAPRPVEGQGIV